MPCPPGSPPSLRARLHNCLAGVIVRVLLCAVPLSLRAAALADVPDAIFLDGFEPTCPGAPPGVTSGAGGGLLLRGTVVTPAIAFVGEVLVLGDSIACVAASCAGQSGADTASVVETKGLIFPGLIDTHNFSLFDIFDENDWTPAHPPYGSHNDWTNEAQYMALVDAKQYLNGEGGTPDDLGCEMDKYAELKALLAGTTSIVSRANPANKPCYGSLTRTIDQTPNDLGADYVQTAALFPDTAAADQVCANFTSGSTHAYLIDIAEGTNATALNEFAKLGTITTTDGCLYAAQTAIVHGTALGDGEFTLMGQHGMSLVWLPQSNVTLFGQTANVPLAISKGINVALGADWSITGSHDLLSALRFADQVNNSMWGGVLSEQDLVQMVTTHAAKTLALDSLLGSIEVGKKADLTVVAGTCSAPWSELVAARPQDVRLVVVGGVPLYGDASLQLAAPPTPGCETMNVCGTAKFACVAETGGTASNKFGQTLADITGTLTQALTDYDALNLTQWKFAPATPLVDCP